MKTRIKTNQAPEPVGPYSQAILSGNTLYISGQIALDPFSGEMVDNSIEDETQRVMRNIEAVLKKAGATFEDVVKCSVFVRDMDHYSRINEVYERYFKTSVPARELVEVSRLPKDANLEISCIAVL